MIYSSVYLPVGFLLFSDGVSQIDLSGIDLGVDMKIFAAVADAVGNKI